MYFLFAQHFCCAQQRAACRAIMLKPETIPSKSQMRRTGRRRTHIYQKQKQQKQILNVPSLRRVSVCITIPTASKYLRLKLLLSGLKIKSTFDRTYGFGPKEKPISTNEHNRFEKVLSRELN